MKKIALIIYCFLMLISFFAVENTYACSNQVDYSYPANGDTGVDVNTLLRIRFYDADKTDMFQGTINWGQIYFNNGLRISLRQQGSSTNLLTTSSFKAVSFDDLFAVGTRSTPVNTTYTRRYEITPSPALLPNTTYILTISKNIKNYDGCGMSDNKVITFTTGAAAVSPTSIIDKYPAAGATNVLTNISQISVKFDQQVDDTSGSYGALNASNFYISPAVSGTLSYDSSQAQANFVLSAAMTPSTVYTVTVKNIKDTNGNYVKNGASDISVTPYVWTFTTKSGDTTPPTASVKSPTSTTSIPINQAFQVQFSEAMDPATITTSNIYINGVSSTISYDAINFIATLTPTASLNYATDYTLTVTTGVKDISANNMLQNLIFSFTTIQNLTPAPMNDYCQLPPFISGASVKPNVLLMMDNSGSMNEFAYKTKGTGDSSYDTSYDSSKIYYGYFDYTKMYSYSSANGHFLIDTAASSVDKSSFWSGNFLNWLTMRRVDVVRKVLVGGKITPRSISNANYALIHDNPDRDYYKRSTNTNPASTNSYILDNGKIYQCVNKTSCSTGTATNTYNGKIYVGDNPPDEGLIIKMWDQINFGIMFFNDGSRFENSQNNVRDGGYVGVDLGSTGTNLITQVENTDPSTWTPLAEAFYEGTHYYMATTGPYNNSNYGAKDPITHSCQKNFILILTDGESTKDQNLPGGYWGSPMTDSNGFNVKTWMDKIKANEGGTYVSQWNVSPNTSDGSYYLEAVAYWAHTTDLRSASLGKTNISGMQNVTTYAVFAFDDSNLGRDLLQKTCKYGGFEDTNSTGKPDATVKWDRNNDGIPDTYFEAQDGSKLQGELQRALLDILTRVSSGTAAAILNNSEGSGASLLQAVFYPRKGFENGTEVTWVGEMQNLWYYLDPYFNFTSIRVDTVANNKLNLLEDYVAQFYFDSASQQTRVRLLKDTVGDGSALTDLGAFDPDDTGNVKSLWRAGRMLWARNLTSDPRTLYTRIGGTTDSSLDSATTHLASFTAAALKDDTTVQSYLQAANATDAEKIIKYISGIDQTGYRSRAATIAGATGTWRLGDIVSSTPKIQGNVEVNTYDRRPPQGYSDASYKDFITSNDYQNRGMVYSGANDGMLHAFKLGVLSSITDGCRVLESDSTAATCRYDKVKLNDYTTVTSGTNIGKNANVRADSADLLGREQWAFIPRQVLPYLKYLGDPEYPHLFYVDGTPQVVDVSINKPTGCTTDYWDCTKKTTLVTNTQNLDLPQTSWRTILIGSSGQGGASRNRGGSGLCYSAGTDCVKTPLADLGYSTYFALDVTNPNEPKYMWEFNGDPAAGASAALKGGNLGYATTGPIIVRVGKHDKRNNGRWFAIFASGPTGPINTTTHQFMGRSDQPLSLFIVDVATGSLVKTITTNLTNAFAGSLYNASIDNERTGLGISHPGFYEDDVVYIGYVQKNGSTNNWDTGGVLRLVTNESIDPNDASKPWTVSTLISGIGPVTSAVTKGQFKDPQLRTRLFLYFGDGRYYYKNSTEIDDAAPQRRLFGIMDPCFSYITSKIDPTCTTSVAFSSLDNQTTFTLEALSTNAMGWYINLDTEALADGYASERVITDPVMSGKTVFFTTFRPTADVCGYGGNSYIWAVSGATGTTPDPKTMSGRLLMQVSTGAFAEISMTTGFTGKQNRRITNPIQGVPPKAQGLSLLVAPRPLKKVLQILEK